MGQTRRGLLAGTQERSKCFKIKFCLACGEGDLAPRFNGKKNKAVYKCESCSSLYRGLFVRGECVNMIGLLNLNGQEYMAENLPDAIFERKVLLSADSMIPMNGEEIVCGDSP